MAASPTRNEAGAAAAAFHRVSSPSSRRSRVNPRPAGTSLAAGLWQRDVCGCDLETIFRVRVGPDYKKNHQKAPSLDALYELVCFDGWSVPRKHVNIAHDLLQLPPLPEEHRTLVNGVPAYFLLTVTMPDFEPANPLWGSYQEDGPGHMFSLLYRLKESTRQGLANLSAASPAIKLLHKYVTNIDEYAVRSKFMANVLNPGDANFGFAVRKLLTEYNMKPVLTRPQHTFHTDGQTYFELDVDVYKFAYVGRKGWAGVRKSTKNLKVDLGFCVEGHADDELPECMLGVTHIHCLDVMALGPANFLREGGDDDADDGDDAAAACSPASPIVPQAAAAAPPASTSEANSGASSDGGSDSDSDEFHDAAEEFEDPGCD